MNDHNTVSDSFYLKEYIDFIYLLDDCDLKNNDNCYRKLEKYYKYKVVINRNKIFDNNCQDPKIKIHRVYYNKDVVIYGC